MHGFRNNHRCLVDSIPVERILYDRIKSFLPDLYPDTRGDTAKSEKNQGPGCEHIGLNERFRFLRYDEGMYFKPHNDGSYHKKATETTPAQASYVTLQLYLN